MNTITNKFNILVVLFFTVILAGCLSISPYPGGNITNVIAHRGASGDALENSLEAFYEAFNQGAQYIEGDFQLTSDKKIVAMHDKSTLRVADKNLIVTKSTYADLQKLTLKNGEKIPLLSEVLDILPDSVTLVLEIKSGIEIVPYIKELLSQEKYLTKKVRIIAFDYETIVEAKKQMPHLKMAFLKTMGGIAEEDKLLNDLTTDNLDGLSFFHAYPGASRLIEKLRNKNLESHVWTVNNDYDAKKLISFGVNTLTTDYPSQMLRLIDEFEK